MKADVAGQMGTEQDGSEASKTNLLTKGDDNLALPTLQSEQSQSQFNVTGNDQAQAMADLMAQTMQPKKKTVKFQIDQPSPEPKPLAKRLSQTNMSD